MAKRKADVEPNASAVRNRRSARNKPNEPEVKSEEQNKAPARAANPKSARSGVKKADNEDGVKLEVGPANSPNSPFNQSKVGIE